MSDKDYLRKVDEHMIQQVCASDDVTLVLFDDDYALGANIPWGGEDSTKRKVVIHSCKEGNGKPQLRTPSKKKCVYCGREINTYKDFLVTKEFKKLYDRGQTKFLRGQSIYVERSKENPENILIKVISTEFSYVSDNDEKDFKITATPEVKFALEVIPGVSVKGYKILKKTVQEIPAFEALNINSKSINSKNGRKFIFEDADDCFDFIRKNKVFAQRTGLLEALKLRPSTMARLAIEPYMLLHLCMISQYPALELLIKMGYSKLYFDLIGRFIAAESKTELIEEVKHVEKIFTTFSKGSMALRFPNYIGDYLKLKAAPPNEYLIWCDIYEQQQLTKEQFTKYINSSDFIFINMQGLLHFLPQIMCYGYSIEQLSKYVYKQSLYFTRIDMPARCQDVLQNLLDYLSICDLIGITPNKFPMDVVKAHNEVMKLQKSGVIKDYESIASKIAKQTQNLLDNFVDEENLTKMQEIYEIKVPESAKDFIEEGIMQNSCVGHYVKKVADFERIVFFVRKKETPDKSFITAEYVCDTKELGQCMYANNRPVEDADLLNFCIVTCNRIKTGILSGKISKP